MFHQAHQMRHGLTHADVTRVGGRVVVGMLEAVFRLSRLLAGQKMLKGHKKNKRNKSFVTINTSLSTGYRLISKVMYIRVS